MAPGWPAEENLRSALSALQNGPVSDWSGTTYRFASRDFADRDRFTDGEGARLNGGRFTPIGGPRTVYLSLDRATALAELDSWFAYYGVPDSAFQPRVLAAVAVSVRALLNLAAPETLQLLDLAAEHLAEEWRSAADTGSPATTQLFGRLVCEVGFEGLVFPSVRRPNGLNFALFPDNFAEASRAIMLNAD